MKPWTFQVFVSASGRSDIEDWRARLSERELLKFDAIMDYLERMPRSEWKHPHFEPLSGDSAKGLGEIRFRSKKEQHRLLGFFGPQIGCFTIVFNARKQSKNNRTKWMPATSIETAQKRKSECENNPERFREWER